MSRKRLLAIVLSAVLCVGMALPAYAAINPFAALEAKSQQAVDTAIQNGVIPPGKTIYDCMYQTGADGVVRVVQYKDDDGNWVDVATGRKATVQTAPDVPADTGHAAASLSDDTLEAYAAEVFRLVNEAREKAGLEPVIWDSDFAACAQIRAEELLEKYSHERPYPVNDGIKWPQNVSGIGIYNAPSVADEQGVSHKWIMENIAAVRGDSESVVKAWMNSEGHRENILKESHIRCGVGVSKTAETLYWVLWFDNYTEN